jgi:hypothetical protein
MNKTQSIKYYCDEMRHLVCVPYSIENLHKMAEDLEIGKHFFHKGNRKKKLQPHYDIPARRKDEIMSKCEVVSPRTILKIIKEGLKEIEKIVNLAT